MTLTSLGACQSMLLLHFETEKEPSHKIFSTHVHSAFSFAMYLPAGKGQRMMEEFFTMPS